MKKNKVIAGTLIGALAGIVAGILTAPKASKQASVDILQRAAALKAATPEQKKNSSKKQKDA